MAVRLLRPTKPLQSRVETDLNPPRRRLATEYGVSTSYWFARSYGKLSQPFLAIAKQ